MHRFKICLLGIFLVSGSLFALNVPQLHGRVNDYAGMLSVEQRQNIDDLLMQYEQQTSNQFAVLTITSLDGDSLEDFSMRTVEKWKLGQKGKNNGLLLLIVKNDRKIRIEVGYGLEPVITDAYSGEVIRDILAPSFRDGNFAQGIADALYALMQKAGSEFTSDHKPVYRVDQTPAGPPDILVMIIVFLFIFFAIRHPIFAGYLIGNILGGGRGGSSGFGGFSGGGGSFGGGGASGGW